MKYHCTGHCFSKKYKCRITAPTICGEGVDIWFPVFSLVEDPTLLTSRSLPLETKGWLYLISISSAHVNGSEAWPVKEGDVIRTKMAKQSKIKARSAVELRNWVQLNIMMECLQNRRSVWFGHIGRMGERFPGLVNVKKWGLWQAGWTINNSEKNEVD